MWKFNKNKLRKDASGPEKKGLRAVLTCKRYFTYKEIVGITANFRSLIAQAAFSDVYYGRLEDGVEVAVKMRGSKVAYDEAMVLTRIRHRNLVSLVGLCEEGEQVMLVLEYMAGGSLGDNLAAKNSALTWRKRLQIALEAATGLHYLHTGCKPSVIHRYINSGNILLDQNMEAKLSGFSLCESGVHGRSDWSTYETTVAATSGYLDPENMATGIRSKKSDVYSFGVVLLQLITGKKAINFGDLEERYHLVAWAMPMLVSGNMENLLDPLLTGRCNIESVREVATIAKAAVQERSIQRPDMTEIINKLQAALIMEISSTDAASPEVPHNPVAGDSSSRLHSHPNMDSYSSSRFYSLRDTEWAEETQVEAANGTTRPETSSAKEAGGIPTAQPSSAVEAHISHNITVGATRVSRPARLFTYNEILEITGNFGRIIGEGGFATVYYGRIQGDGPEVAVKKLKNSASQFNDELYEEVEILMRMHHRNLVSLVGFCEEGNEIILVSEYMASGNLFNILKGTTAEKSELTWKKRLQIALGVATGLEYLHKGRKPAVIHGDIKTTNILLDANLEAKLADFGMSKVGLVDGLECSAYQMSTVAGTWGYMDPEYIKTKILTKKSDVYNFGVVLFELITGKPAIVKITESNERCHLPAWVMPMFMRGDITGLLDPMLQGNCNIISIVQVTNIARAATAQHPSERPDMSDIVSELKAALKMELQWLKMISTSEMSLSQSTNQNPVCSTFDLVPSSSMLP